MSNNVNVMPFLLEELEEKKDETQYTGIFRESEPPKKKPPKPVLKNQPSIFDEIKDSSSAKPDYGLYRCQKCNKFIMGFSLDEHTNEVHGGKYIGYQKIK